jgi:hypothetical protein
LSAIAFSSEADIGSREENPSGPNRIATLASDEENSMTPTTASVLPTNEPTATMVNVDPARPFLAS